jgi:hypothetical protein
MRDANHASWRLDHLEVSEAPPEPEASDDKEKGAELAENGIARLVLTLVRLLHELMERQAVRRMERGTLTPEQVERLGVALMKQAEELDRLRREFDLDEEDLDLDLGPLGRLIG